MEFKSNFPSPLVSRGDSTSATPATSRFRQRLRWLFRTAVALLLFIILYIAAAWILGKIPANAAFRQTADGIEIAVLDNGVHCDLALPMENGHFSWRGFLGPAHPTTHLEQYKYALIGWGNRRFYLETRTWDEFKISTALGALTGLGETVVHVDSLTELPRSTTRCRRIRISENQYRVLCNSVASSFATGEDRTLPSIPNAAYSKTDAFFAGTGAYHLFNTCNVWTGRNLQRAGIRTGWWTPFSFSLFDSLPEELELRGDR